MVNEYLKAEEIAKIFKVGVDTVYTWNYRGLVPDIKKPLRFKVETVEKWLQNRGKGDKK